MQPETQEKKIKTNQKPKAFQIKAEFDSKSISDKVKKYSKKYS